MSLIPYLHLDVDLARAAAGDDVALDADARRHLRTVLRLRPGALVHLADGDGSHATGIVTETGARLNADATTVPWPQPRLVVAQALAKGRKFDEVVRMATELGADAFVPVTAAHSIAKLEGKTDKALARWSAVGRAAAEQARRPHRPTVEPPIEVPAALCDRDEAAVLVAHPGGGPLHRQAAELAGTGEIVVAIGPEGGWREDEIDEFVARGAHLVGLGPAILRTEHAAAAALAVVNAVTGRWDAVG